MFHRYLFAVAIASSVLGSSIQAIAQPAPLFMPYLDQIQRMVPAEVLMRLPSRVMMGTDLAADLSQVRVRVLPTHSPPQMTVSLFSCVSGPSPCLVGSFVAERNQSVNAQMALERHRAIAYPITLAPGIEGYLLDGGSQSPSTEFSSVMWEQDTMIYTVSFTHADRQNMLFMAASMARNEPIRQVPVAPASTFPF